MMSLRISLLSPEWLGWSICWLRDQRRIQVPTNLKPILTVGAGSLILLAKLMRRKCAKSVDEYAQDFDTLCEKTMVGERVWMKNLSNCWRETSSLKDFS